MPTNNCTRLVHIRNQYNVPRNNKNTKICFNTNMTSTVTATTAKVMEEIQTQLEAYDVRIVR